MNIQNIDSSTPFQGLLFKDQAPSTSTTEKIDTDKEQETASAVVNFSTNAVTAGQNTLQNKQNSILERTKMAVGMVENGGYAARAAVAKQGDAMLDQLQGTEVDDEMQVVLDSMKNDIEAAAKKALETKTEQTLTEELETTASPASPEQTQIQPQEQTADNTPQNATQHTENAPQNPSGTPTTGVRAQSLSREAENLAAQAAASSQPMNNPDPAVNAIRNSAAQKEHKPLNIIV